MIDIAVPGFGRLTIEYLVLDFNGTLAVDGRMLPGVRQRLLDLSREVAIHIVTADTFGQVHREMDGIPCTVHVLPLDCQAEGKRDYVRKLGCASVAAIGNGRNDRLMLEEAALGIALILAEGACGQTVMHADVICTSVIDGLALLGHPRRLTATLRS